MMKTRGFTLIELLIVVAIIAILAAIAVPNFLEAQVRAKIARAVSDIRTLTTAIEAYAVDQNNFPFDMCSSGWPGYITDVVTTPIAYVTNGSMLIDPFRMAGLRHEPQFALRGRRYRYINQRSLKEGWPPSPYPGPYFTRWAFGTPEAPLVAEAREFARLYGAWRITSSGPDTFEDFDFSGMRVYDATNGTNSEGDIGRSQAEGAVSQEGDFN